MNSWEKCVLGVLVCFLIGFIVCCVNTQEEAVEIKEGERVYFLSQDSVLFRNLFSNPFEKSQDEIRDDFLEALTGSEEEGELVQEAVEEQRPLEKVKGVTDKVVVILTDGSFSQAQKAEKVLKTAEELFDWRKMASEALSTHWKQRTEQEKKDFTELFKDLICITFMDDLRAYKGEDIIYTDEIIDGDLAVVKVKITTSPEETFIDFWLDKKDGRWLVSNFSIACMSPIDGYRDKLDPLIQDQGYEVIFTKLQNVVEKLKILTNLLLENPLE